MEANKVMDCLIDFDGGKVKGQATHSKGKDQVVAHGFSWNVAQSGTGVGPKTRGQALCGTFDFQHDCDTSSTALHKMAYGGDVFDKVVITCYQASGGQQLFLKCTLKEAVVASVTMQGSEAGGAVEQVSLAYSDIEWEYTPYDEKGKAGGATKSGYNTGTKEPR